MAESKIEARRYYELFAIIYSLGAVYSWSVVVTRVRCAARLNDECVEQAAAASWARRGATQDVTDAAHCDNCVCHTKWPVNPQQER